MTYGFNAGVTGATREEPSDTPAAILIRWPDQPTVCPPSRFDATAAAVMRVLAAARVALARRKAGERRL